MNTFLIEHETKSAIIVVATFFVHLHHNFCILLARRKQKWAADPQNTTWSNDESKFGQKMLERMGWAKGKV